jgi:hypothetical protein
VVERLGGGKLFISYHEGQEKEKGGWEMRGKREERKEEVREGERGREGGWDKRSGTKFMVQRHDHCDLLPPSTLHLLVSPTYQQCHHEYPSMD